MRNTKMYVIDNGKMWEDMSNMIAGNRMGMASNKTPMAEWGSIPIHTFLIDHPDGIVLFDTACDPEGMSKNWPDFIKELSPYEVPKGGSLPERLEQLKVHPKDVKYVVLSHLHVDHAGCLKMFTNSEVFVNDVEFTTTLRQYALNEDLNVHLKSDISEWLKAELHWHLIEKNRREYKLLDGLTIVNFGSGHSWGMLGLLVELTKSGSFLLVADALYSEVNAGPPIQLPGIVYDSVGYVETAKYISDYAKSKNAKVLYGHDSKQFKSLIKSTEGFYD